MSHLKTRLLSISDLKLTGVIGRMDGNDLSTDVYVAILENFTNTLPSVSDKITEALIEKNYDSFAETLVELATMLKQIYARSLADECLELIDSLENSKPSKFAEEFLKQRENVEILKARDMRHEKLEASTTHLLTAVSMLSIDIQMAIYKDANPFLLRDKPNVERPTIYAVDDTRMTLNKLKSCLHGTNYDLVCEISALEALNFLKYAKPDLFILDIEMPELNGYELAGRLQKMGHTAPIIFLTGNSQKEYVVKAMEAGAADFILKPIIKDLLLERISKYV